MKKSIAILLALSTLTATSLAACGQPTPKTATVTPSTSTRSAASEDQTQQTHREPIPGIEIRIDGNDLDEFFDKHMQKTPISGVRRHFHNNIEGTYTIEYVHTPQDITRDDTLEYDLTLNADNTFTLNATSNGVQASHYGHWYTRRDNIMLYYDEPIDPTAHNVYVADMLYAERLSGGKLLVYDNCHTIILSKQQIEDQTPEPEINIENN